MGHRLGKLMRSIRKSQDLSLRRLAELSGLYPAQLSRVETGQISTPTKETVERVAGAFCAHESVDEGRCREIRQGLLEAAGHAAGDADLRLP